jgi:YidC/Oxa1 family membrane protein insertase
MNRKELLIVIILGLLLILWPSYIAPKLFPPKKISLPKKEMYSLTNSATNFTPAIEQSHSVEMEKKSTTLQNASAVSDMQSRPALPEKTLSISNEFLTVTVSSYGASITRAELHKYRKYVEKESPPVVLDFADMKALTYSGLTGCGANDGFELSLAEHTNCIVARRKINEDLTLERRIVLKEHYLLEVHDVFYASGSSNLCLPERQISLGIIKAPDHDSKHPASDENLGIDALMATSGEGTKHWETKLIGLFPKKNEGNIPVNITKLEDTPVDWLAVKSKFFVQILKPQGGALAYRMFVERKVTPEEKALNKAPSKIKIAGVSSTLVLAEKEIAAGSTAEDTMTLYIGPKKLSILKTLGLKEEDVMDFGMWRVICYFLVWLINGIYQIIPNYGVAIILVTIIIRVIFWPLTHKSNESMKKMQQLQPLIAELRTKYKDNPRKMQEEMMALYKANKVNPLGGCIPMLIQIPVFIALFYVLKSAIELRFAEFLWIKDLSEPERLLYGSIPFLPWGLNILPIFMAVTQGWQTHLMPSTDPAQQKLMVFFMPVMMLVLFYNMPSALILYWTANQVIMIVQQLVQKYRIAAAKRKQTA